MSFDVGISCQAAFKGNLITPALWTEIIYFLSLCFSWIFQVGGLSLNLNYIWRSEQCWKARPFAVCGMCYLGHLMFIRMTEKKGVDYRNLWSLIKWRLVVRLRECEFPCLQQGLTAALINVNNSLLLNEVPLPCPLLRALRVLLWNNSADVKVYVLVLCSLQRYK